MKLNKSLSAYPILCENDSDYADGYFAAMFDRAEDGARIAVSMQLQEDAIAQCIAAGTASYLVHVECPMTSYRKKYLTGARHIIDLPLGELVGEVEISTYVIATEMIQGFTSQHFNAIYAGRKFLLPKGSLLAIGPIEVLEITREGSGAQTLPDIFQIYGDQDVKSSYWVDLTQDTIDIHVTPHVQAFYHAHPAQKYLLNEMLILPAATEALTAVAIANENGQDENDYASTTWYRIFDDTLQKYQLAMTDLTTERGRAGSVMKVAQMLFHQPLDAAIDALGALVDHPEEE